MIDPLLDSLAEGSMVALELAHDVARGIDGETIPCTITRLQRLGDGQIPTMRVRREDTGAELVCVSRPAVIGRPWWVARGVPDDETVPSVRYPLVGFVDLRVPG